MAETKAEGVYCNGCKTLLAVCYTGGVNNFNNIWYCFSCASNIGLVADTIAVISGNPGYCAGLPNVPSEQDICKLYSAEADASRRNLSATTKSWCRDKRQESTEEKISKLLAEC